MKSIYKMGLVGQLISAISLLMVVTMVIISLVNIKNQQNEILKKSLEHLHAMSSLLNESAINYLDDFNVGKLRLLLSDVTQNPDIVYSYIFDSEGIIVTDGTASNPLRDEILTDAVSIKSIATTTTIEQFSDGIIDITSPIYLGEVKLGGVRIGFSLASLEEEKQQVIYKNIQLSLLFLLFTLLVTYFIAKRITQPLKRFTSDIANFDLQNNEQIYQIDRTDEIGELSTAFYNLVEKLKLTTASKEHLNEEITQRKKTEQALLLAVKKANIAAESKSAFLANMSHEIRTPMNGVLGMLELILLGKLDKEQKHRIEIAKSSADSLLTIINDILDFSKIDADKLALEHVEFDLRTLMEYLTESMALLVENKNIELILDLTRLNHAKIKSDPNRLKQILTNIIGNAIKFTEQGEILISAELIENNNIEGQPITQLFCKIKDTGIGINKEQQATLFEVFSQEDASTTRKYGGTGLGLSISQKLCKLMGGDINVISEKGEGSCFEFNITIEKSAQLNPASPAINLNLRHILIVDGNATNRRVLQRQLSIWGASAVETENAETALRLCSERINHPDLPVFDTVLIDKNLSKMNAETFAKYVRGNENFNHMKLVLMLPIAEIADLENLSLLGFNAHFQKPITTVNLLNALAINNDDAKTFDTPSPNKALIMPKGVDDQQAPPATYYNNKVKAHWPEKMRVLLVEDNKINQMVALCTLKSIEIIADVAENGLEALICLKEAIDNQPYTLVIMDCQMPEMDGYEATKKIRAGEAGSDNSTMPIIAMTANAMQGDKEKCIDAGMDDYLTKPIDSNLLREKLTYWANKNNTIDNQ